MMESISNGTGFFVLKELPSIGVDKGAPTSVGPFCDAQWGCSVGSRGGGPRGAIGRSRGGGLWDDGGRGGMDGGRGVVPNGVDRWTGRGTAAGIPW